MTPILDIQNLYVTYPEKKRSMSKVHQYVKAIDGVNLKLEKGEVLGIAGESGCGKSTLARVITGLQKPTSGQVFIEGESLPDGAWPRHLRKKVQMVFQDASGFLDPRQAVYRGVVETLSGLTDTPASQRKEKAMDLLAQVGIRTEQAERYPHELSGGQRQRVAIARSLAADPDLIVLDEPTSALDVSVQAQILNLLDDLRQKREISLFFISHDLQVLAHICDRIGVMYLGKFVEIGSVNDLFEISRHPYSRALLASSPEPTPHMNWEPPLLMGEPGSALEVPNGCSFHPRCQYANDVCKINIPDLSESEVSGLTTVACHFPLDTI